MTVSSSTTSGFDRINLYQQVLTASGAIKVGTSPQRNCTTNKGKHQMPDHKIKVTTIGSPGSATGTGTSRRPVYGVLGAVQIDYHASAPGATTDVVIAEGTGQARTFLTRTNTATDGTFYPAATQHDGTGTALTSYAPYILVGDYVTVTVTGCDALTDAVVVTLHTLE